MDKYEWITGEVVEDLSPLHPHRTQHQSYPSENAGVDLHSEGTARVAEIEEAEVDTGVALSQAQMLAQKDDRLNVIYHELMDAVREGDESRADYLRQEFMEGVARPVYKATNKYVSAYKGA